MVAMYFFANHAEREAVGGERVALETTKAL
jgi:hypothetical protein